MAKIKNHLSSVQLGAKPRTKKAMVSYLLTHFRYETMSSWNQPTSYSANVKVQNINFASQEARDRAYDIVFVDNDEFDDEGFGTIQEIKAGFAERHYHQYQIGTNGRSGGYFVLYKGGKKLSEYKSRCLYCGQENFKYIFPEDIETPRGRFLALLIKYSNSSLESIIRNWPSAFEDTGIEMAQAKDLLQEFARKRFNCSTNNKCGRCGETRHDHTTPQYQIFTYPGKSLDMYEDFEEMSFPEIKERVELVRDFDLTVNRIVEAFITICEENEVIEQEIQVPQMIKVLSPIAQL